MNPALPFTFVFLDTAPDFGMASQSDGFMPSISYETILFYRSLSTFVLAGNLHLLTLPFSTQQLDIGTALESNNYGKVMSSEASNLHSASILTPVPGPVI